MILILAFQLLLEILLSILHPQRQRPKIFRLSYVLCQVLKYAWYKASHLCCDFFVKTNCSGILAMKIDTD